MGTSCSDVCELVQEMLNGLGFSFDDTEASHDDMIEALGKCTLIKDKELAQLRKPKKVYIHVRGGVAYEGRVPKGVEVIIKGHD